MSIARTAPLKVIAPSRLTVGTAAVQGTAQSCHGVLLRAVSPGQTVYVGVDSGVTTATGFPMADGNVLDLQVGNVNSLWFIASAAAQAVALMPYRI